MKPFLAIVFCLIFSSNLKAQDWAPFNLKESFNYRNDTSDVIVADYFSDSVKVFGSDSVFLFE
jgi:hypothetical protein